MKKITILAVLLIMFGVLGIWIASILSTESSKDTRPGPSEIVIQPNPKVGEILIRETYEPPLVLMPELNKPPDPKRCSTTSPVQTVWKATQNRSMKSALDLYVEEEHASLLRRKNSKRLPYMSSHDEQIASAKRAMKTKVYGVLRFGSMAGDSVAVVLMCLPELGIYPRALLKQKGDWRAISSTRTQGGKDVELLVNALTKLGVDSYQMPKLDELSRLASSVRREAEEYESRKLLQLEKVSLDKSMQPEVLISEAEKCRLFLLELPKSTRCKEVRKRLERINGFLKIHGKEAIRPYSDFYDFMESRKEKEASEQGATTP